MRQRRTPIARRTPIQRSLTAKGSRTSKRRKKPAKQRKTTLGAAKRTLWDYFARYIKGRDGNQCFTCDAHAEGAYLHAGHLFSRSIGATLYDPLNCHSQCAGCNRGRRGNIPEYVSRFMSRYGGGQFTRLTNKARQIKQWTMPEVRELTEALKRGGADFEAFYMERYGL